MSDQSFADLYRPGDQMEVMLIRMVLDATDISYYIVNENLNRLLPVPAADMVVRVERERAVEAARLLAEAGLDPGQLRAWKN